jgi:hypothetical protein
VYEVFSTENASECVRLLMISLKDCTALKDFAVAAHALERYWGQRRAEFTKQRAFVDAHVIFQIYQTLV